MAAGAELGSPVVLPARAIGVRKPLDQLLTQIRGDGLRAHLVRGATASFALKIANGALALGATVLLARLLGAEGFGVYAFAMAGLGLLGILTQSGLPALVVRQVAAYRAKEDWSALHGLLRRADQAVLGLSLLVVAAGGGAFWLFADDLEPDTIATFAWALALLPLIGLGALRGAALRGLRHVVLGQVPEAFVRPLVLLVALGLAHFGLGAVLAPSTAMILNVCAAALALACGAWWLWWRLPVEVRRTTASYETRAWMRSALALAVTGGFFVAVSRTDIFLLGVFRTSEEVGTYAVATRAAAFVVFGLGAINGVVAPNFSKLYAEGDRRRLERLAVRAAWAGFAAAVPVAVLFIFVGGPILVAVFGAAFEAGQIPLAILSAGQVVSAAAGSVGLFLNMTGHERDVARVFGIAAGVNVLGNLVMIPAFGATGAAIATAFTIALWNVLLTFRVARLHAIWPTFVARAAASRLVK